LILISLAGPNLSGSARPSRLCQRCFFPPGQVNAEVVNGTLPRCRGGALDFARAASHSAGAAAIIALPSTAGPASRIVAELSGPVSTPRADVNFVVTEHGSPTFAAPPSASGASACWRSLIRITFRTLRDALPSD
jgi:hypothetical protein